VINNFKDIRAMDVRAMTQEQALASLKKIMQGWWDSKFESRKSELASDWDKGKLEEMNFSITSGKGIFFGTCLNCRKKGHHATECRTAKKLVWMLLLVTELRQVLVEALGH